MSDEKLKKDSVKGPGQLSGGLTDSHNNVSSGTDETGSEYQDLGSSDESVMNSDEEESRQDKNTSSSPNTPRPDGQGNKGTKVDSDSTASTPVLEGSTVQQTPPLAPNGSSTSDPIIDIQTEALNSPSTQNISEPIDLTKNSTQINNDAKKDKKPENQDQELNFSTDDLALAMANLEKLRTNEKQSQAKSPNSDTTIPKQQSSNDEINPLPPPTVNTTSQVSISKGIKHERTLINNERKDQIIRDDVVKALKSMGVLFENNGDNGKKGKDSYEINSDKAPFTINKNDKPWATIDKKEIKSIFGIKSDQEAQEFLAAAKAVYGDKAVVFSSDPEQMKLLKKAAGENSTLRFAETRDEYERLKAQAAAEVTITAQSQTPQSPQTGKASLQEIHQRLNSETTRTVSPQAMHFGLSTNEFLAQKDNKEAAREIMQSAPNDSDGNLFKTIVDSNSVRIEINSKVPTEMQEALQSKMQKVAQNLAGSDGIKAGIYTSDDNGDVYLQKSRGITMDLDSYMEMCKKLQMPVPNEVTKNKEMQDQQDAERQAKKL